MTDADDDRWPDAERVGRIELSARTLAEARAPRSGAVAVGPRPAAPARPTGPDATARRTMPLILPPARLEEELGGTRPDPVVEETAEETAEKTVEETIVESPVETVENVLAAETTTQAEELAAVLRDHPGAAAAFRAVASDDAVVPTPRPADEDEPAIPAAARRPEGRSWGDDVDVVQSVSEVASAVIAAMRAVGEANARHLEAVEVEAARRYELLTAQAELDAELIRLHARREAHAIIAAARLRTGEPPATAEADPLGEIGETFSRFAEGVETVIGLGSATSDLGRRP
jgi:hypothetical protein